MSGMFGNASFDSPLAIWSSVTGSSGIEQVEPDVTSNNGIMPTGLSVCATILRYSVVLDIL